jgi:hypothetical protein
MFRTKDANGNVKYTGRSKAVVLDNRDPLQRGRIQVDHPLLGNTAWIDYLRAPGEFSSPSIGDVVFVECDSGEYEFAVASGIVTRGEDANPFLPSKFKRDIPTNRGFFTPGGHSIELDDGVATITDAPKDDQFTTTKRGIRITSRANNRIHIIEDTAAGEQYILLQDAGGNLIKMDYKNNQLTINSIGKTKIDTATDKTETVGGNETTTVTGNQTKTVNGNQEDTISGNLKITVNGSCDIKATGATTVEGSNITLKSPANTLNGGVVTDNTINNDPITGIPLQGVGGVVTS